MKEVMAVIRMNMMNKTKVALSEAGISSFTAREALGRGRDGQQLYPKRILFVAVPDNLAKRTIETIIEVNQTGKPGDGKIFILPVFDAVRIRTGEEGEVTLDGQ